jgi:hypothetical protein
MGALLCSQQTADRKRTPVSLLYRCVSVEKEGVLEVTTREFGIRYRWRNRTFACTRIANSRATDIKPRSMKICREKFMGCLR